jgi:hypothetical protein
MEGQEPHHVDMEFSLILETASLLTSYIMFCGVYNS